MFSSNPLTFHVSKTPGDNKIIGLITAEKKSCFNALISFLTFKDIVNLKLSCKSIYQSINRKTIKPYVHAGYVSQAYRKHFYLTSFPLEVMKLDIIKQLSSAHFVKDNLYQSVLNTAIKEKSTSEAFSKVCVEIYRDVTRTFYTDKFTKGNGKEMIDNILTAIAYIRPEIGYCQGMNFIAGALITYIEDEESAFYIFLSFIDNLELNMLYLKNMPDYSIRVFQLNYYIKKYFPRIFNHFKKKCINVDLFFSKWILAIFSSFLEFDVLCNVWDVFCIEKWKSLFKFSMVLIEIIQEELIHTEFEEYNNMFKKYKKQVKYSDLSPRYDKYKITNSQLEQLREEFFVDMIASKLNDATTVWDNDQSVFVDRYKRDVLLCDEKSSVEATKVQGKIEHFNKKENIAAKSLESQMRSCENLKLRIQVLIETKACYTKVLQSIEVEGTEKKKIEKKLKKVEKEIEHLNEVMLKNYILLDKKTYRLEKVRNERSKFKMLLEEILKKNENEKKELITNLSQKLKLSVKFVATSKY